MFGIHILDILILVLYIFVMIGIGYFTMKRIKNQEDFFMGGRAFGKIIQTFAAFGTGTTADSPISTARNTFTGGISGIWTSLNWLFCTPFYWIYGVWYRRMRYITLGDLFEERYNSKGLGAFYAVYGIVFFMVYLSLGFSAIQKTVTAITPKSEYELTVQEKKEYESFKKLKEFESYDYESLTPEQKNELETLRDLNPKGLFSYIDPNILTIILGIIILVYGLSGGLAAAYFTDLMQGILIIFLSFIIIPFAFREIGSVFGGSSVHDVMRIMHVNLPAEYFDIFGSSYASDFTWYYVMALVVMNLIGIVVQPHNLSTGGGSAKDELSGRTGYMVGNLLKRFCTILWSFTALTIIVLYSDKISDPDLAWGYATKNLLGPLGIGLVGLMMAALFAAMMSSSDCFMISTSALLVHNIYRPFIGRKTEKHYVFIGRIAALLAIVGGIFFSIYYQNIFQQLKVAWELNIIFAASFWAGMFWRRGTKIGAWCSISISALLFFILPALVPALVPGLRTNQKFLAVTEPKEIVRYYEASEFDVRKREMEIKDWEKKFNIGERVGEKPSPVIRGETLKRTVKPLGQSIYWTKGIKTHEDGRKEGQGFLNLEMIFLGFIGIDLKKLPNPMIETLRLPFRIIIPFLILIPISLFTPVTDKKILDRFYVKLKTPVNKNLAKDREEVEKSYKNPSRFDHLKMFPNSRFEFTKWDKTDIIGFALGFLGVFFIILLTIFIVSIGA